MEQNGKLYLTSDESVLFDDNYRYKISQIQISHITKKGTKITILTNIDEFSRELMFDKNIIIRILGKKLSCKSGRNKNNDYYLQGEYATNDVKNILYEFIQHYLLCSSCDKPEIDIKVKKNMVKQKCRACGNNSYLDSNDLDIVNILNKIT
jgi:translation initiation factor 5